jgi:hypothetical protein
LLDCRIVLRVSISELQLTATVDLPLCKSINAFTLARHVGNRGIFGVFCN